MKIYRMLIVVAVLLLVTVGVVAAGPPPTNFASIRVDHNASVGADLSVGDDLSVTDDLAVTDDAAVGGDLTVTGSATYGSMSLDDAEVIGTLNVSDTATFTGAVTVGVDGTGNDVTFYSDTAGDTFLWDESAEALILTGTNGQDALTVADGNVDIADDLDVDGTTNLDVTDIDGAVDMASTLAVGGDITLENDETIGNGTNGTILMTADSVDISAGLDVDGTADLDEVDIDGLVNVTRTTGTTGQYEDLITAEWTNTAADASYGSNGIYASVNPDFDVQNVYGLRARMDMRGATGGVDVNQLHAIDGLININETQVYTANDNISVIGMAMHGGTSGDIVAGRDLVSLNLLYGVWGPTADTDVDAQTNGILLVTHDGTYVDYGIQVQSSSDMDAGLFLNSHASNAGAKMDVGVEMTSGSEDMVNGIDMSAADFTGADIVGDSGETLDNGTDTAWVIGGFIAATEGTVIDLGAGGTITPTATYQPITNSTDGSITSDTSTAIADGPVAGAILILVNEDAQDIVIKDGANTVLSGDITLTGGAMDTLTLIWNGTDWVGVSVIDN